MGKLFRNKYHIGSIRLKGYDYSSSGMYFVTINTKDRIHYFGEIKNGEMVLSEVGEIAQQILNEIPLHLPFAGLNEFVIMPDHIHVIIIINEIQKNQKSIDRNDDAVTPSSNNNDSLTGIVEPLHATALPLHTIDKPLHTMDQRQPSTNIGNGDKNPNNPGDTRNMHFSSISPSYGSLATIVRSFKSAVTIRARGIEPDFAWQSKFHDHIIRTNAGLSRIRKYIKDNPSKWGG